MKKFVRIEPTTVQTVGKRFKRQVVIKTFETDDGAQHEFTTYGKEGYASGAVVALAKDKRVITTYQFRAGPERWMYELPGGGILPGEDHKVGVLRELKEETGYVPGKVVLLGSTCRDAYINNVWYYYLATDCTLSASGWQLDKEEEEQGVEVRLISIEQLLKNAVSDEMTDPVAVLMAYDSLKEITAHGKGN